MTILLTGGAGYIGSVVTERLLERGHSVVVLDNLSTGFRSAVHPDAIFVHGDLNDRPCLDRIFTRYAIDGVIHMAAKALIPESVKDPEPFYTCNLAGGMTLLNAMVANKVRRFIMSSTAAVYGQPDCVPIDESFPTHPMNSYGESKLSFERVLYWYAHAYNLEVTTFRYFSAAGASRRYGEAHQPETHLLPRLLLAALAPDHTGSADIYGTDYPTPDGTCIRDFIHVIDLADAHIRALEVPPPDRFRIFNMGSGTGFSVLQVVEMVEKVTGRVLQKKRLPRRAGDPAQLVATSEKVVKELNWKPLYPTLEAILESAWHWHQAHPTGYAL
jgi:UDP-glucose 4-epimerase